MPGSPSTMAEPSTDQQVPLPNTVVHQAPKPSAVKLLIFSLFFSGIPEHFLYKNRLQEYTHRLGLPLPTYHTVNEGAPHAQKFRSTVLVFGTHYTSLKTFFRRKEAEQDIARIALLSRPQKTKDEGRTLIREDRVFCKSILNEYAVKMNLEKPTYQTIQKEGLPSFTSHLVFNGVTYTGDTGINKKEAEQLAARAVILSILDSEPGNIISEIINSKSKLYAALYKVKDTCNSYNGNMPLGMNTGNGLGGPLNEEQDVEGAGTTNTMPITAVSEPCMGQTANMPATYPPIHVFKKPRSEPSYEAITPSIVFVPAVMEQSPVGCSTSGRKRKRKNKKAKKEMQYNVQLPVAMVPSSQVPPCSIVQ